MRHVEVVEATDLVSFWMQDTDIPEIEEPEGKLVLWVGSLDTGMVIYGIDPESPLSIGSSS